jgi:DNA-binding IclR family transcriptional regulator/GNAT superfamily N-acetyltransferase
MAPKVSEAVVDDVDSFARIADKPGVPHVRAVERAIALLRAFAPDRSRLTLTELAQLTALDKGTARRLLRTLAINGLVSFDARAQHYMLDAAILEIASAVQAGSDLREIASPILAEVAEATANAAFLGIPHEDAALCIDRVRAPMLHIDTTWFAVGARAALKTCGAGPRIVLAYVGDEQRVRGLAGGMPRRTAFSETSPAKLRRAAKAIRERGWELATDDFYVGLAALGVPILDRSGFFAGALSTTGLTVNIAADGTVRHLNVVRQAADRDRRQITRAARRRRERPEKKTMNKTITSRAASTAGHGSAFAAKPRVVGLGSEHRADWEALYAGYAEFYRVPQTPEMRATVWGWLQDPTQEVEGLVALDEDGRPIGLAHVRAFARPLAASVGGFLDDLFVTPEARGSGATQALIDAAVEGGRSRGWTVLRWLTADDNYRARSAYDRMADRTKWITYEIKTP